MGGTTIYWCKLSGCDGSWVGYHGSKCPYCEIKRLREESCKSEHPCSKCGGEVVEFTVDNEAWNTIIRRDGKEHDNEYLCVRCFGKLAADKVKRLRKIVDSIPTDVHGAPQWE